MAKVCKSCGKVNTDDCRFCMMCGKTLEEDIAVPKISVPEEVNAVKTAVQQTNSASEPETADAETESAGESWQRNGARIILFAVVALIAAFFIIAVFSNSKTDDNDYIETTTEPLWTTGAEDDYYQCYAETTEPDYWYYGETVRYYDYRDYDEYDGDEWWDDYMYYEGCTGA